MSKKKNCDNCQFNKITFSSSICSLNAYDYCLNSNRQTEKLSLWRIKEV